MTGTAKLSSPVTTSVVVHEQIGSDVALLLARLLLGATMGGHGLVKVFGLFGGPGVGSFEKVLQGYGFTRGLGVLAWITGLTEVGAGALLVLGLFTPLAAAGLFGVGLNIVLGKIGGGFFEGTGKGYEFELTLAVLALAVLLAGPGRLALDVHTPWRRRPFRFGLLGLVPAIVATVALTVLF